MTALAILMLAATLQAPPADPADLGEAGRELFRIEREAAASRTEPATDSRERANPGGPADGFDTATADALRNDAWLHDVCFVDAQRGWAVGDRGTIWHSEDGGRNWQLQDSGVACTLWSVCFVDADRGWAAGGFSHPYLHTSSGVVLATRDGGRHWYHDRGGLLPGLKRIGFFDAKHGWAAGDSSALFPGGVFNSRDGGRSWTPLGGGSAVGWTSGDFFDPQTGILAGRNAATAAVRQGQFEAGRAGGLDLETLRQLRLPAPPYAWLVGDGGAALWTSDLGGHWQEPPRGFPRELAAMMDLAALAVRGPQCWMAGSPGSRVLHTPDGGRTWSVFPTPTRLPLSALTFVDDRHGWAVGALGTILASEDGGRTWRSERCGGTRAAVLGLFGQEDDVPLELLARLSGDEGYLAVVEVLGRRDLDAAAAVEAQPDDRLHEAVVAVGGCGGRMAWQFPLRQKGLQLPAAAVVDGWDRFHGGRGWSDLESRLVRQIRLWRPEVIVTNDDGGSARGDDAAGRLIARAVAEAIAKAADPRALAAQTALAGLEPWQVKRAYAALPPGSRGTIELLTAQWAPRLGRSLADVAERPRGLIDDRYRAADAALGFRSLTAAALAEGGGDFLAGDSLPAGGGARRQPLRASAAAGEFLQRLAQRRRHTEAILDQAARDPQAALRLLAQSDELTRGLDPAGAASILYRLADRYAAAGRGDLAAEAFELLADHYPDDPLCRPALVWLLQYYASGEEAQRARAAGAAAPAWGSAGSRLDRAVAVAARIARSHPDLFADPAVRFPAAAAYRQQGQPQQAQRLYAMLGRGGGSDAWSACARGELWLLQPKGAAPKPTLLCVAAPAKPRLDGRLDDAVWRRAKPVALRSSLHDDAQWPATVMLAHDDEFLYIAVQCRQAPGARYEDAGGRRLRDADLSAHDRVDVLIDLDRDFATYYRLTIDHRGWTADSCWGDSTWDPTWYVAARTEGGRWTAEAAVPLGQLTARRVTAQTVWAVGLQRTVPGVGFQSWTTPARTTVAPEGFGYLTFEGRSGRPAAGD
jgi:photosystem II stability/assembly factor-like uncharacterized protein/tetratricopeptide (TPR) repeat protein